MDRFIVKTYEFQYISDNTLKSNMDRFIGYILTHAYERQRALKSNMDRFIGKAFIPSRPIISSFKIQYG